ncbi:MAG: S-layer homology domain-containing protein [Clostridia bacterium]|nr:S-layer homology domain-containing protein [Clostridia bacterium]
MKRIVAMLLIVGMMLTFSAPFVFAENGRYVSGGTVTEEGFATREEAVASLVRSAVTVGFATDGSLLNQFADAAEVHPAYRKEMTIALANGWLMGYEDQTLRPKAEITRLEALVLLKRILGERTLPKGNPQGFVDLPDWAKDDIRILDEAGIVKGYGDGILGAEDLLTATQLSLFAERTARMTGPWGDFYEYVNQDWLKETELLPGQNSWSNLDAIHSMRMKEIGEIVYSLHRRSVKDQEVFPKGSSEQKIADVFAAAGNTAFRDSLGLEPAKEYLLQIDGVKNMKDLLTVMAKLESNGFHGLFPLSLTVDMHDSTRYILTFSECYTGMNVSLLQSEDAEKTVAAYRSYLENLFRLFAMEDAKTRAKAVAALCLELGKASMSMEAHNDIAANDTVLNAREREKTFARLDVNAYLKALGFETQAELLVYDLPLAKKTDSLWKKQNLELLKDYLRASVLDGAAIYLNTDAFLVWREYQDTLNGVESGVLPGDYAMSMVQELLGWDIAKIYVERFASPKEKQEVEAIAQRILEAYRERLSRNTWMSEESRAVALRKIENLKVRVAYPEDMEGYLDEKYEILSIREGGNLLQYRTDYCKRYFETAAEKLKKNIPVNRDAWNILPQTVNALYEPSSNSVTIPAGILDAPIYYSGGSVESKLGSIGGVIAHEISHALDSLGSQFDENGNLNNWWLNEDKAAFDAICERVIKAYEKISIHGVRTLAENLADLAAMECVLDIAGRDNPRLGDLFGSYAVAWRNKTTPTYLKWQLMGDTHAPDKVRVNRVLSNFDAFANFYGLEEGDGMYIPPEERIAIW